jgi:hypothetical protein
MADWRLNTCILGEGIVSSEVLNLGTDCWGVAVELFCVVLLPLSLLSRDLAAIACLVLFTRITLITSDPSSFSPASTP